MCDCDHTFDSGEFKPRHLAPICVTADLKTERTISEQTWVQGLTYRNN